MNLLRIPHLSQLSKPGVDECLVGAVPHLRPQLEHPAQQIQPNLVHLREDHAQVLRGVDVPIRLVFRELRNPRPGPLRRGPHQAEDFLQLVFVGGAGKERPSRIHFRHDAAGGPDVDAGIIRPTAEEDVRSSIPERHDLVRKRVDRNPKSAGKAKIGQFQLTFIIDQQVLGFEIAVEDPVLMAKGDSLQELVHEGPDRNVVKLAARPTGVHVFLEIFVHILEHEHQFVLGMYDIMKGDDIFMFELLHQRNFSDGGRRGAFF